MRYRSDEYRPYGSGPSATRGKSASSGGEMMIATRSFTAELDGETVPIVAGRDRVAPDHEIVQRHPDAFTAASKASTRTAAAAAPRTARLALPRTRPHAAAGTSTGRALCLPSTTTRHVVHLSTDTPRIAVSIGTYVRDTLIAMAGQTGQDGMETGGQLFGIRGSSDTIYVDHAYGPGPGARRTTNSFAPDRDHDHDNARFASDNAAGVIQLGHWHTHPTPASTRCSDADRRNWAKTRHELDEQTRTPHFVGLILSPHQTRGWRDPTITAYVTTGPHRTGAAHLCQLARITTS